MVLLIRDASRRKAPECNAALVREELQIGPILGR